MIKLYLIKILNYYFGETLGGGRLRQYIFNIVVTEANSLCALFISIYILINECLESN